MKKIVTLYKKKGKDEIEYLHIFKCDNDEEFQNEFNKMYNNTLAKREDFKGDKEPLFFEIKSYIEGENNSYNNRVLIYSPTITLDELKIKKYIIYNIKWTQKGLPDHLITYIEEPSIDFIDKKYFDEIHNKYINSYIEEDLIRLFGISPKEFEFSDLKTYEENSFNSYMNFSKAGGSNE